MQELTLTSALSLFETTKAERESFCNEIIERLNTGEADPLKMHLQLKCAEDIIKRITGDDTYKKFVLDISEQQGGKSFTFHNAKFEIKEMGVKYDYSQTGDAVISRLQHDLDELTEKVKARQKFLQTVPQSGMTVLDEGTGEAMTVYPPSKSSTTSVAVTLK